MSFFTQALSLITGNPVQTKHRPRKGMTERDLIELESEIGGKLFGTIPAGHRRDFFCLDEQTWVWHEEWIETETGKKRMSTTRYEVHANGILKAQDGINYRFIEGEELTNFALSVRLYFEQTSREVYGQDPYTGRPLETTSPATM